MRMLTSALTIAALAAPTNGAASVATIEPVVLTGEHPPGAPEGALLCCIDYGVGFNDLGQVAFTGGLEIGPGGVTLESAGVVFGPDADGNLTMLARAGEPAPGAAFGVLFGNYFRAPRLNDDGLLIFLGHAGYFGIWGTNHSGSVGLLAGAGTQPPGAPEGAIFYSLGGFPLFNDTGELAFDGSLQPGVGGVYSWNDTGIWGPDSLGNLSLIAQEGSQAPDAPPGARFDAFRFPDLNDQGDLAFLGTLRAGFGGVTVADDAGLWGPDGSGALGLLVREGDPAPGAPDGARFRDFFLYTVPDLNDAGEVAFLGLLEVGPGGVTEDDDLGIWITDGVGTLQMIAREGDPAPGAPDGARFSGFDSPLLNDRGEIAFRGYLQVGPGGVTYESSIGIWGPDAGGDLTLRVWSGDPVPEVAPPARFVGFYGIHLNDEGELALHAEVEGAGGDLDRDGIFFSEKGGDTVQIVLQGDTLELTAGDLRELGLPQIAGLNDSKQVAFAAYLSGEQGLFIATVPEPSERLLQTSAALAVAGLLAVRRRGTPTSPATRGSPRARSRVCGSDPTPGTASRPAGAGP